MIIVSIYPNAQMAAKAKCRIASALFDKSANIKDKNPFMFVLDGNEVWFIGEAQYPMWCKGKTYWLHNADGWYHSGYKIEKENEINDYIFNDNNNSSRSNTDCKNYAKHNHSSSSEQGNQAKH